MTAITEAKGKRLPTGHEPIHRLEMTGIVKRFPGVLAADKIDFDVNAGEIHALLGENGAGKSTLMKMLYGLYHPDEGQIRINGAETIIRNPQDAIQHGIGMIHQHFYARAVADGGGEYRLGHEVFAWVAA